MILSKLFNFSYLCQIPLLSETWNGNCSLCAVAPPMILPWFSSAAENVCMKYLLKQSEQSTSSSTNDRHQTTAQKPTQHFLAVPRKAMKFGHLSSSSFILFWRTLSYQNQLNTFLPLKHSLCVNQVVTT